MRGRGRATGPMAEQRNYKSHLYWEFEPSGTNHSSDGWTVKSAGYLQLQWLEG